jgi:histidine triad (HIT) family protein
MADCIFCKLARKELPAHTVHETETMLAFLDRSPIQPGHLLVVPKKHEPDVFQLDEKTYLDLMATVRRVASAAGAFTRPKRMGLLVAGWDVPHAHVHVVPMNDYHDLTSKRLLEGNRPTPDDAELTRVAEGIRAALK